MNRRIVGKSMMFRALITAVFVVVLIGAAYCDWAVPEVEKAKETEILPESFEMEYGAFIKREEFAEIAVKLYEALSGRKAVLYGENPFKDTDNKAVGAANSLGIVNGVGDHMFDSNGLITRQEISVILYRALKVAKPEYDFTYGYDYIFSDDYMISPWAREAVGYLYGVGVVNGVGDNLFNPRGNTSKEEAIVLTKRIFDKASASKESLVVSRSGTSRRQVALRTKLSELLSAEMGKPYKWGGTGPNSYDCSGLVYVVYGKLGISLPRVSRDQARVGTWIAKTDLEYGDLVFFAKDGKTVHHVGIYVGDGEFVHAPQTGDVVKRSTIMSGYYDRTYYSARRVF